jgi:hypothetical protein
MNCEERAVGMSSYGVMVSFWRVGRGERRRERRSVDE